MPERLVDVDVPEPGERALVEQRRLERRAAAREPLAEARAVKAAHERLRAQTRAEVRLELAGLEQQPGAEAAHVAVADVRPVV